MKIGLLLPSYRRYDDLVHVLTNTVINDQARFIVIGNYEDDEFARLKKEFGDRADFIDERQHGKTGVVKAYNLAYETAIKLNYEYVMLFADDIVPASADWLDAIEQEFVTPNHDFGIFSSDECHPGYFGWNFIKNVPVAHFFILKTGKVSGSLFDTRYRQYVVDFDVCLRALAENVEITLLPIRVLHSRSPLHRELMNTNFDHDKEILYQLFPKFRGCLDSLKTMRFIQDKGQKVQIASHLRQPKTEVLPYFTRYRRARDFVVRGVRYIKRRAETARVS